MARLLTTGAELQGFDGLAGIEGAIGFGGTGSSATFDTAVVRSGLASYKFVAGPAGAGATFAYTQWNRATAVNNTIYYRAYVYFNAVPDVADDFMQLLSSGAYIATVRFTPTGTIRLMDSTGTQVGSDSAALSLSRWYRVELSAMAPNAGNGTAELRLDGAVVATSGSVNTGTAALIGCDAGSGVNGLSTGMSMNIDDIALNDSTGGSQNGYPGSGKVVLMKPISPDNSRTGYTGGAGGTTNLFDAVNNTPPIGLVLASATNASQIKDVVANLTDNYIANLAAYTTALGSSGGGLTTQEKITLVQPILSVGNSNATAHNWGVTLTNPTIAESTQAGVAAIAGTWPSNWVTFLGTTSYAPTPTLGTSPTLKVRKNFSTANANMVSFMGLLVEYVAGLGPEHQHRFRSTRRARSPLSGRF